MYYWLNMLICKKSMILYNKKKIIIEIKFHEIFQKVSNKKHRTQFTGVIYVVNIVVFFLVRRQGRNLHITWHITSQVT